MAAQVVEHHITGRDQATQHFLAAWMLQVQREALLVAVEALEIDAVLVSRIRRHVAPHVTATCRLLDLDHLGAKVAQQHRRPRPGAILLGGEDADSCQRWRRGSGRLGWAIHCDEDPLLPIITTSTRFALTFRPHYTGRNVPQREGVRGDSRCRAAAPALRLGAPLQWPGALPVAI